MGPGDEARQNVVQYIVAQSVGVVILTPEADVRNINTQTRHNIIALTKMHALYINTKY